ncbi:MAG: hypothetical protein ACOC8Y_01150 [Candidatus Natronoplasma sp.]
MKISAMLMTIIIVIAGTSLSGCLWKEESYTSEYNFEINLETTKVQENLILYTPLPRKNDTPIVNESEFLKEANIPENWTCEYMNTEHGVMLKIEIERLEVDQQYEDISLRIVSESRIDTRNALENEPIISPVYNLTEDEYDDEPYPDKFDERMEYYRYDSYVYVENLTENSELNIYLHHMGTNEWWVLGWTGNEYRNRLYTPSLINEGWHEVEADLIQGWGNY